MIDHVQSDGLKEEIDGKKVEQFMNNIKIIHELSKNHPDIGILKSYKGFGGLKQCFNSKQLYGKLMNSIRGVFSIERERDVFNTLRHSCNSAYYTPKEVVRFMYRYVSEVCQFNGGAILEPACGNGVFFEYMPENILNNSQITGIEMDLLTSKLVKSIYPTIQIINQPLQDVNFKGKKYDLVIGNPPYSGEKIIDPLMEDISNYTIHHYFTAKCIRLLNENGILAFVLPSYFFDIPRKNTRAIIDGEAVLIDAVRLPENLFDQAKVTVDIIFFRKSGKKIHNFSNTVILDDGGKKDNINEFWQKNPHRILGKLELKWVHAYKRYVPCCVVSDKNRILNYLINCKFNNLTFENYYNISCNQQDKFKFDSVSNDVGELLYNNFIVVEELCGKLSSMVEQFSFSTYNSDLMQVYNRLCGVHKELWIIQEKLGLVDVQTD